MAPFQSVLPISAIEIKLLAPHLAHAVSNGPYSAVDIGDSGAAVVSVDGRFSHTHGVGLFLTKWIWKEGANILATEATTSFTLPVGVHDVALTVVDSGNNAHTDMTTITVLSSGYPDITGISPSSGSIVGSDQITITGSGFTYPAKQTIVHFGNVDLSGNAIQVINATTIQVLSPAFTVGAPVEVSVKTPRGTSTAVPFTYVAASPIAFLSAKLTDFESPTAAVFGPDGKLYVGSLYGKLAKLTLNDDFTAVTSQVISMVANYRAILEIAFDPMDAGADNPPVYCTSSYFFHRDSNSSSGNSINGKVHKVSGGNLDNVVDVITGLPVADHDHGLNGIVFGDSGELYIQIGSNTNGGIPGPMTSSQQQKENYYSAATLVAHLADPLFDGMLTYDATDDGTPNGGYGIKVFAPGNRNPFGIVLHSNGYLYGTDNGPNLGYGSMMMGCGPCQFIPGVQSSDKINLLQKGNYYGHPNLKRAAVDSDPRQCKWRNPTEPSDSSFTAPVIILPSSTDGIIEYQADHFNGQLRGNLITSKYQDGLFRVILNPDGLGVDPQSMKPIPFCGDGGLDVTQAPNGNMIDVRLNTNTMYYYQPNEAPTSTLGVKAVFPQRGGNAGGTMLSVYGVNLNSGNSSPAVTIGGRNCPVVSVLATKIVCTLPGGSGTVDIVVTGSAGSYTFQRGFRYITGHA